MSILGHYEVLALDQCLMYCFSSPEELQEDPALLMHKETVQAYDINSIACFIPINDFRERVFNVHQALGTMPALLEESMIKRDFLNLRKSHNKLLKKMLENSNARHSDFNTLIRSPGGEAVAD